MPRLNHSAILALMLAACSFTQPASSQEVTVYSPATPVVIDRDYNILAEIKIVCGEDASVLNEVDVCIGGLPLKAVRDIRLVGTGTASAIRSRSTNFVLQSEVKRIGGGQDVWCNPSFVKVLAEKKSATKEKLTLSPRAKLRKGDNYMYVSARIEGKQLTDISLPFTVTVDKVVINGQANVPEQSGAAEKRLGVSVRQHGDDGVYAYRIPGIVTSKKGTLIAVYDIRYESSLDLQNNIDIGVSRSTDGGRSWGPMIKAIDMGEWDGLPEAQNGVGDPAVLVDETTGRLYIAALWTHGIGAGRAWTATGQGMSPEETGQIVLAYSDDDGRSWSKPESITSQVKQPEWYLTLQGPGRGITMKDGTLVFPIQHIGSDRIPCAGIMYSRDGGKTWATHEHARTNTTEAQVAELPDGSLMLSMRDNRKTGRAVSTSSDMGRTWKEHPSSGTLPEPVCMASLINAGEYLLFSNPAVPAGSGRNHTTIRLSRDNGLSWNGGILLDEEENWGYSCMTMIDEDTVGILYESSVSQLLFQAVKLKDLLSAE